MRIRILLMGVLLLTGVGGLTSRVEAACAPRPGFAPAAGKTLMVVGVDLHYIETYDHNVGITPGGTMVYANASIPHSFVSKVHAHAARYPTSALQLGVDITPADLATMASGGLDAVIKAEATILKQIDRPIYMRFAYEVERGGSNRAYNPTTLTTAWKRMVDIYRAEGVTNVAFVWHLGAHGPWTGTIGDFYPGDDYVDWVAVSLFAQVYSSTSMTHPNNAAAFAAAHGKPLMIAESTPYGLHVPTTDSTYTWNRWFQPVVDWIVANDVKAWSYIHGDWNISVGGSWFLARSKQNLADAWPAEAGPFPIPTPSDWGDSRIPPNVGFMAKWIAEVSKPRYLHASATLFCDDLGYG